MNIKNFLKLTCTVFIASVISTENVSSNILTGLANKAKSAVGNAKKQVTTSVSGLKTQATELGNKAKQTVGSIKTNANSIINSTKEQAATSLSAVKKAASDAISSIDSSAKQNESSKKDTDEELLLDDVSLLNEDSNEENVISESKTQNETLPEETSEELLLDDNILLDDTSFVSRDLNKSTDELLVENESNINFPEDVIVKVDSLFPDNEKIISGKIINLSNKNLNDEDVAYIAMVKIPALSENIEKITLKLSNNNFTNEGLKVLLDSLKSMPKLVSILDCSENSIGDEGAMAIADSCKQLPLTHTIILSNCEISGTGILGVLSSILEINNSAYQYLDLSKNDIDPSYAPLILEKLQTIKENTFEDGINLRETGITIPEGIELPENIIF